MMRNGDIVVSVGKGVAGKLTAKEILDPYGKHSQRVKIT